MVNLNGNVPKLNFGLSIGIIALIGVGIVVGGIFIQETKYNATVAKETVETLDKKVNDFIETWFKRITISNKINNGTQNKIESSTENILRNLTDHRHVTNATYELQVEQEKQLIDLQNKTNALIKSFNATNEEERGKAVQNIIDQLHQDHVILFKALNITAKDNQTDSETDILELKKAIEALENRTDSK